MIEEKDSIVDPKIEESAEIKTEVLNENADIEPVPINDPVPINNPSDDAPHELQAA